MKQTGLGRGLDAIFDREAIVDARRAHKPMGAIDAIEVVKISPNPKQPRTDFDETALEELADSIRALGIIQPLTVRSDGDRYIIISGERRWRAAQLAGLDSVPAYIREADDQNLHEMALVENIQRQDLNPMEVAISLKRLMEECSLTQDKLSERVGKKRSTIANYMRLMKLPDEAQLAIKEGIISMGHAKAIASAPAEAQRSVLRRIVKKGLSVRQTEELVAKLSAPPSPARHEESEFPDSYSRLVELLESFFSENISIKAPSKGKGKSKIVIEFNGESDIERFIERFERARR